MSKKGSNPRPPEIGKRPPPPPKPPSSTRKENYVEKNSHLAELLQLKHGKEIAEVLFKDKMSDSDKNNYLECFMEITGTTLKKLNDDIQTGINNGYSIEFQMNLLSAMFSWQR